MPRSFYEWMAARREWYSNRYEKLSNIPHPGAESPINVIYQRQSNNPYWENRRQDGAELVPLSLNFHFEENEIEQFIRSAAQYERQKEQDFLSKFYTDNNSADSYVDKFNILFQSREQYKAIKERINYIINEKSQQKNKTYGQKGGATHEYFTGMAPNISSIFMSYFEPALKQSLDTFFSRVNKKVIGNPDLLNEMFDDALAEAAITASERIVYEMAASDVYGSGEEWRPILEMLQKSQQDRSMFVQGLKQAIGFNNLNDLKRELTKRKLSNNRAAIPKNMKQYIGSLSAQTAQLGGTIEEVVAAIIARNIQGKSSDGSISYQMDAAQFGGNIVMTDMMMLFSQRKDLDLGRLLEDLRQKMNEGGTTLNMREVYKRIENFYIDRDWDESLNELYMVYTNAKNYGIGADGSNYTKSYQGPLEELPDFLTANGIKVDKVQDFLNFAYNTGKDAIRYGQRTEFWQNCVNALKAVAANIMFDDYQSIGHGNQNAIHMYLLSGKYIPSSIVLDAMADAAKDSRINSKANVNLPEPIQDAAAPYGRAQWAAIIGDYKDDASFKEALWRHWQDETNKAKQASNWSISFTLRIKEILSNSYNM